MANELTRNQILEKIIDIFVEEIGFIKREEISASTHITRDFKIYTDDITIFLEAVEKYFDMLPPLEEWSKIATFDEFTDLTLRYRGVKIPRSKPSGLLGWLFR
ncbi:hypothetical protein [Collimonas antrihumi]|uniref:hypothetical protein n=1 Tax=Collimonas antrihumi TaxID=1940615 RepID=UPI001B8CA7B8|nr:hypothetical protein [Collimonas antrihumi]